LLLLAAAAVFNQLSNQFQFEGKFMATYIRASFMEAQCCCCYFFIVIVLAFFFSFCISQTGSSVKAKRGRERK